MSTSANPHIGSQASDYRLPIVVIFRGAKKKMGYFSYLFSWKVSGTFLIGLAVTAMHKKIVLLEPARFL